MAGHPSRHPRSATRSYWLGRIQTGTGGDDDGLPPTSDPATTPTASAGSADLGVDAYAREMCSVALAPQMEQVEDLLQSGKRADLATTPDAAAPTSALSEGRSKGVTDFFRR